MRTSSYLIGAATQTDADLARNIAADDNAHFFIFTLLHPKTGKLDLFRWAYHIESTTDTMRKMQYAKRKLRNEIKDKFPNKFHSWY